MNLRSTFSKAKSAVRSALSGVPALIALPVAGVCALAVGVIAAALTTSAAPVEFTDSKVPAKVLGARESTAEKAPDTTANPATPPPNPANNPTAAPAPAHKPVAQKSNPAPKQSAPAPKTPAAIQVFGPTALKIIVHTETARDGGGLVDTVLVDYTIEGDGTYPHYKQIGPSGGVTGPGKRSDAFCGSSESPGVASIVVNYTAPNGIYTCSLVQDLAYTRYQTNFRFEITDEDIIVLPGYEVLPARQI